jgi:hypothetical protein
MVAEFIGHFCEEKTPRLRAKKREGLDNRAMGNGSEIPVVSRQQRQHYKKLVEREPVAENKPSEKEVEKTPLEKRLASKAKEQRRQREIESNVFNPNERVCGSGGG